MSDAVEWNAEVQKYCKKRVEQVFRRQEASLREKCRSTGHRISAERMAEAIREEEVELKPGCPRSMDDSLWHIYDFSELEAEEEFDQKAFDEGMAYLRDQYNRTLDAIILGSEEKARQAFFNFTRLGDYSLYFGSRLPTK